MFLSFIRSAFKKYDFITFCFSSTRSVAVRRGIEVARQNVWGGFLCASLRVDGVGKGSIDRCVLWPLFRVGVCSLRALHRSRVESMSCVGLGGSWGGACRVLGQSSCSVLTVVQAGVLSVLYMRYTVPGLSVDVFGDLLRPSPLCYDV